MRLALVRHGRTAWNVEGRIQGHTDVPLCPAGREQLARLMLPQRMQGWSAHSSPLSRAVETATLLGLDPSLDERLREMDWGEWEGEIRAELRASGGGEVARIEARGVDFRPPGGESTRELMSRLDDWVASVQTTGATGAVAVTHKGVIRAALALATGWDFLSPPPARLDFDCVQVFEIGAGGRLRTAALNLPFAARTGSSV